jgi:hypothetical protein
MAFSLANVLSAMPDPESVLGLSIEQSCLMKRSTSHDKSYAPELASKADRAKRLAKITRFYPA